MAALGTVACSTAYRASARHTTASDTAAAPRPTPQAAASPTPAVAGPIRPERVAAYTAKIRDMPFDYGRVGSVLEALAYLELQKRFPPPTYRVLSSVGYYDPDGRTMGELDLLVWNEQEERVTQVYEVKLSRSLAHAGKKADRQLWRLRRLVQEGAPIHFKAPKWCYVALTLQHFRAVDVFGKVGSRGARELGWDVEVDLYRDEADHIQERLLERTAPATGGRPSEPVTDRALLAPHPGCGPWDRWSFRGTRQAA